MSAIARLEKRLIECHALADVFAICEARGVGLAGVFASSPGTLPARREIARMLVSRGVRRAEIASLFSVCLSTVDGWVGPTPKRTFGAALAEVRAINARRLGAGGST